MIDFFVKVSETHFFFSTFIHPHRNTAELKNSTVVEVLQNLPEVIKIHGFVSTLRIDDIDHPVVFLKW